MPLLQRRLTASGAALSQAMPAVEEGDPAPLLSTAGATPGVLGSGSGLPSKRETWTDQRKSSKGP